MKGKTAEDSVRFTINLHTASADFSGNDVPLHISVRFDEGKVNVFSLGDYRVITGAAGSISAKVWASRTDKNGK